MDKFHTPKIQIYVTMRCNLKCKLCGTFCPYLNDPQDLDFDVFIKDVTRFFELTDTVGRLELTGGEPLLNPRLPDMVDFLQNFCNRIDEVRVLSNGRSLPSVELLRAIRRYTDKTRSYITVLIDNYGPIHSPNSKKSEDLFKENGAKVISRAYYGDNVHMGGWVDFDLSSEVKRTKDDFVNNPKCGNALLQMHSLWEGVIYPCGRGIYYHNVISPTTIHTASEKYLECVFIHDSSKTTEQKREELFDFYKADYYKVCCYCNGLYEDSKRFVPAEQIEK